MTDEELQHENVRMRRRLGAEVCRQRIRAGLTQAELAQLADISPKFEGEIERGEVNFSFNVLVRLAVALDWRPCFGHAHHEVDLEDIVDNHLKMIAVAREGLDRLIQRPTLEEHVLSIAPELRPKLKARRERGRLRRKTEAQLLARVPIRSSSG